MQKQYKHIIFDFDGTLADSGTVMLKVFNSLADKYGFSRLDMETYRQLSSLPVKQRLKILKIPFYRTIRLGKVQTDFNRQVWAYLDEIRIFDGMEEVLDGLRKSGYVLSILSSNLADNVIGCLKRHGIDCFQSIHTSAKLFGKDKVIRRYLKRNALSRGEVLYVGDELRDIEACRKSAVDILAVTWGLDGREALEASKPAYVAYECGDILKLLRRTENGGVTAECFPAGS
jgi:phosphoglycolate phosphatase